MMHLLKLSLIAVLAFGVDVAIASEIPSDVPSQAPSDVPSDVPSNGKIWSVLFCWLYKWIISSSSTRSLVWIIYHLINVRDDVSNFFVFSTSYVVPSLSPSDVPSEVPSDVPSNSKFCSVLFCSVLFCRTNEWYLARRFDSIRFDSIIVWIIYYLINVRYNDSKTLFCKHLV